MSEISTKSMLKCTHFSQGIVHSKYKSLSSFTMLFHDFLSSVKHKRTYLACVCPIKVKGVQFELRGSKYQSYSWL